MKLSEMTPETNSLHRYFEEAVQEFHETGPWAAFVGVHMRFEVLDWGPASKGQPDTDELRAEFGYMKYVKQKLQIFRYYGDLLQTEQSKDPQVYAAPEGHVEAEIRPERLDGVKADRPRINVYVPEMKPKELEENYTKRPPTDQEIYVLSICLKAGQELFRRSGTMAKKPPLAEDDPMREVGEARFEPFEEEVEVAGPGGGPVKVRVSHPCKLSRQVRKCAYCSRRREGLARCAGCKVVHYCTAVHQKLDWKAGHKQACPKHAELVSAEAATWSDDIPPRIESPDDCPGLAVFLPDSIDTLEQFHSIQEPVVPVDQILTHGVWCAEGVEGACTCAVSNAALVAAGGVGGGGAATWKALFDVLGLCTDQHRGMGVVLSQVATMYHTIYNLSENLRAAFEAKDEFVVHVPDACLEPCVLETYRLLLLLLPGFGAESKKKLRIVFIGRRLDKALHYRVVQWKSQEADAFEEAIPSGQVGDVWRGADGPLACRFYTEDYATFQKKCEGSVGECDLVLLMNVHSSRHNFFHSTSHACANAVQKKQPTAAYCYTVTDAENVSQAFADVSRKQRDPDPLPAPTHRGINPFRNPLKARSDYPVPCHPNAALVAWL
eukprot:TRINITY_DN15807_c0_g1_i2.p1 TRINITY_DN15807_c0_g1~~TRINITY_DN15807_c0_g1_i2.p1  ORF type:complete len:639 (+),score=221.47 TRINITY_DN15807_c0_g1_i2:97-1917(+)